MISQKAIRKMYSPAYTATVKKENIEAVAVMTAAGNVLIEDITQKGKLVIKHLPINQGMPKFCSPTR